MMERLALPKNAFRALKIERLHSRITPLSLDVAAVTISNGHGHREKWLSTWAANITRADVEKFSNRKFIFVGMVGNPGQEQRENYEEML